MKIFLIAVGAALIVAICGGVVLNTVQEPADRAFSTEGVRLGV